MKMIMSPTVGKYVLVFSFGCGVENVDSSVYLTASVLRACCAPSASRSSSLLG